MQIDKPKLLLEKITGKPVIYFAYPYGTWSENAIHELDRRGIKAAYQLLDLQSNQEPLFTIRRLMVSGSWTPQQLQHKMKYFFYIQVFLAQNKCVLKTRVR